MHVSAAIAYLPDGHPRHRLDVFPPKSPGPVVLFVHGGYWVSGDRGLYAPLGRALASRGVLAVIPSYRLAPETNIDGILADVLAALAWTETHARDHGGDPERLYLMGHSAGGHVAALLASDPDRQRAAGLDPARVRGFIALSPILDVPDMADKNDAEFNDEVTLPTFGPDPDKRRAASPMAHFSAATAPLLLAVGENDFGYLIPQARGGRDKLRSAGAPLTYREMAGYDHMDMVQRMGDADGIGREVMAFIGR